MNRISRLGYHSYYDLIEREYTFTGIRTYQIDDRYEPIEFVCGRRVVINP